MPFKKESSLLVLMLISLFGFAQFPRFNAPVFAGTDKLEYGFAGGLISPQFSEVDLNNDGIEDLFIFDKAGDVVLTFLNNGTPNQVDYVYSPFYEQFFPDITDWALLRDYNGDGIKDIFAYSDAPGVNGAIVYTGKYIGDVIQFDRYDFTHIIANNTIPFPAGNGYTQVFITSEDYPAIDDIDDDGDLDILTFAVGGGHVYYFENQSVEMGYDRDSLIYILGDDCWGRFYESGISEVIDLSNDIDMCSNGFHDDENEGSVRHVGSTLLTFDNDADGDKELLLGDVSFGNLNLLSNEEEQSVAFMTSQDTFFPSYNLSTDIQVFPASFYLDVNNDGIKDLLASPNVWKPGENHEVVWRYQNEGATNQPVFNFLEKDFIVDEMIDLGKEAHPAFVDYNADGLLDLVVGNNSFYRPFGERASRLYLFENTGTVNNPRFELVDEDYLNFSNFDNTGNNAPTPTFGDLDSDGDMDILIGEEGGGFYYGENIAESGTMINIPVIQFNFMGLDLGARSVPQLVDLNRDGLLDIVAGVKAGNLVYFQNEGTAENPMFVPNVSTDSAAGNNIVPLGNVDTRFGGFSGYSAPFLYDFDGDYGLFTGSDDGFILKYSNIDGNLDGTFTLDTDFFGGVRPGFLTIPVMVDINNDDVLEMYIGNSRGGVTAYKTNLMTDGSLVANEEVSNIKTIKLYPNPARDQVNIELEVTDFSNAQFLVYNAIGQLVYQGASSDRLTSIPTANWGKGLFVVQVKIGEELVVKKLIVN